MDLILASTSPYRRDLLARLRIPFRTIAPPIDEDALKRPDDVPVDRAERLAIAKAASVLAIEPGATVIGSDQVVAFRGRALGKPGTVADAIESLLMMAGQTHEIITAVAVADPSGVERTTVVSRLTLRPIDRDEATRYVAADAPLDCAGSYRIESLGIALFDRVETDDQAAIVGLPLIALGRMLRARGVPIP